jgi:hypothetical protein
MEFPPHGFPRETQYTLNARNATPLTQACRRRYGLAMSQPEYISFSQFTTYLSCSEKYRLSRILQLEEDPAWYFAGGTAVHAAADAIDHALLADKVVPF